jgi:hypothetical protein
MSRPKLKAPCADCGIDTLEPGPNWYMVHDDLWHTAWPTAGAEIAEPLREILADAPVDAGGQYDFGFERCAEPLANSFACAALNCVSAERLQPATLLTPSSTTASESGKAILRLGEAIRRDAGQGGGMSVSPRSNLGSNWRATAHGNRLAL